jgi:hypothetical protein
MYTIKSKTAVDALEEYQNKIKEYRKKFPKEDEYIKKNYQLVTKDKWKMTDEDIEKVKEKLNIQFASDIIDFLKEFGNFQIGTRKEDDYGEVNYPLIEFEPLLEFWQHFGELDEFVDDDIPHEIIIERLQQYVTFIGNDIDDGSIYCLDKASMNKSTYEMNIEQFYQDGWYHLATKECKETEDINLFSTFIIEFLNDKLEDLKEELEE